jgi:hypothetical protein
LTPKTPYPCKPSTSRDSSNLGRGRSRRREVIVQRPRCLLSPRRPALEQPPPPHGRVEGARAVVQGRVHVREEVPYVTDSHAHHLVLGDGAVQHQTETHQDPRQVRRREDQQAEEAQPRVRVAPRPDVDERRRQRVPQEWHGDQRGEAYEAGGCVEQKPREVRRRPAGRFLQQPRVPLQEEDVEHQVQRQGAEVEERRGEAPVLERGSATSCGSPQTVGKWYLGLEEDGAEAVEQLEGGHDLALHESTGEDGGGGPPPGTEGHLPEPGLEGEARLATEPTLTTSHHLFHLAARRGAGGAGR